MGEDYGKQHIVPKRYLDRFAIHKKGKYIIGVGLETQGKTKLFPAATDNIGYIKDFYDVNDKEDPKYWEHYFARTVDSLCGTKLQNFISGVILSNNNAIAIQEDDKAFLSRIIMAQVFRIPASFEYIHQLFPAAKKQLITKIQDMYPNPVASMLVNNVKQVEYQPVWGKEIFLNYVFDPVNFEKYCSILRSRVWVVYANIYEQSMPFITSDNPVLIDGLNSGDQGIFENGLSSQFTCVHFPITPSIVIGNYPSDIFGPGGKSKLDGKKIVLDDLNFILKVNMKLQEQAFKHFFIPKSLFDFLENQEQSNM